MTARRSARGVAAWSVAALAAGLLVAPSAAHAAADEPPPLTNLAHLDFLLDEATPPADVAGHTTYRLAEEPVLLAPWTYADARDGGTFERIGGGAFDPATGDWGQGAYNADDITRAAVVYVRHAELTGDPDSRRKAYELLRSTAYLQTTTGEDAGNVVLWMQPDGTLNPSAEPVELPDPSDSGPSYWLARTLWALGEGAAAFSDDDPEFAAFLRERVALSVDALERDVLDTYGQWVQADGVRVPAWLIVDGADATAEAVLGLSAYVAAFPDDAPARDALWKLAAGVAAMGASAPTGWPYGAVLPWALSPSIWHAWGSQMPAALAAASVVLGDPDLLVPARTDAAVFTPTLLTAGGPDNGWNPAPVDRVQIAYGADSRVQSLLGVAEATGSQGFADLAAVQAAWFFGANHAGAQMYDPATGVTYDGLAPDGTVNRNSGAESTIHGLLTALALDANPEVAARATSVTDVTSRTGLRFVEAETAATNGTVRTPDPSWTGESGWSGDALTLSEGQSARIDIGRDDTLRWIEPVMWLDPSERTESRWRPGGTLTVTGPAQGVSPAPGVLRPVGTLRAPVGGGRDIVAVTATRGELDLDGLLVRPFISRLVLEGEGRTELVNSAAVVPQSVRVGEGYARVYDAQGELVRERELRRGGGSILLPPGGFALVQR